MYTYLFSSTLPFLVYTLFHTRTRGKHGPESRISPLEESPVIQAMRNSINRSGEPVFLPMVGMEFNSAKEAKDFYNLYSWEIGFGIRKGRNRTNDNNYTTRQYLVCSCEVIYKLKLHCVFSNCLAMPSLSKPPASFYCCSCRVLAWTSWMRHAGLAAKRWWGSIAQVIMDGSLAVLWRSTIILALLLMARISSGHLIVRLIQWQRTLS
jgi:hypothetical protein